MKVKNLIIGAGPAGLATAGAMRHAGLDFEILEQSDMIAPKWHQHYDRLHLHTVKDRSSLPYQDFPSDYPTYISKHQLIEYYNLYAKKLDLKPHFKTKVQSVVKSDNGWQIQCCNSQSFDADNVVVATGLNRIPKIPKWQGQEIFNGDVIHASRYKNPKPFQHKKVLVVGMGNTGAEIALDLAENNVEVGISVRSEQVIVPRDFLGRPVQLTGEKLAMLPFGIGNSLSKLAPTLTFGDLRKYGLPISNISPTALRLKHGKTPTIDLGTVEKIKEGKIKIFKDIKAFEKYGVRFRDQSFEQFEAIILATGYYAQLDDILGKNHGSIDQNGEPTEKTGKDQNRGLYFIGYEKHSLGGILGTLKKDADLIVQNILQNV